MNNKQKIKYIFQDKQRDYCEKYYKYFDHLFSLAAKNGGLNYLFTLLRVSGISDGGWDPFVEAEEALEEYSALLRREGKKGLTKTSLRLGLLIYCHAIEMSAPYQIFFNLMRCVQSNSYMFYPYPGQRPRRDPLKFRPAGLGKKIEILTEECRKAQEDKLMKLFNQLFDDSIRNSFYHSSYTLTKTEFRTCEANVPRAISFVELSEKLAKCFMFYSAFFHIYKRIKNHYSKNKRYHRLPDYQVLEIIRDKKEGLVGYKMHFSNGSIASFERSKERVVGVNVSVGAFGKEGVSHSMGNLNKLKKEWIVNGKLFEEKNTRYNLPCVWMPIIYRQNTDKILKEIRQITNNETIQGCLFYIKCTGYKAVEFVLKSNKALFNGNKKSLPRMRLYRCKNTKKNNFIYDGVIFLDSDKVCAIQKAINRIERFVERYKKDGFNIFYRLKYLLKILKRSVRSKNKKTFSISIKMDDPRNTLCISDLRLLPKSDWQIKEEWLDD
ncbi:hypothetical protein CL633_01055 [bacterium]|nr:hypothetical protein [bacterium]|tara:strand:- start:227 stop:1708 length:1482 start_codon:yes stop_codon:yes gene_type:complete